VVLISAKADLKIREKHVLQKILLQRVNQHKALFLFKSAKTCFLENPALGRNPVVEFRKVCSDH
jgi:hypothetical protein